MGGLTLPRWQTARPAWLPAEFYWVVGCNYNGMPPGQRSVTPGANMSFRRTAFDLVEGGFLSGIGRTSSGLPLGCEETEFCIRLPQQRLPRVGDGPSGHNLALRIRWPLHFSVLPLQLFRRRDLKGSGGRGVGSGDGLSAERGYTTRTLPAGVLRGIMDVCRSDVSGAGRATAIIAGLAMTAIGYLRGKLGQTA